MYADYWNYDNTAALGTLPFGLSTLWALTNYDNSFRALNAEFDLSIGCVTNMQTWMPGYTCNQHESYLNFNGFNSTYNENKFVTLIL